MDTTCDHYFGKIFLHLAGAIGISAASAEYVDIGDKLYGNLSPLLKVLLNLAITLGLFHGVYQTQPNSPLKYGFFAALAFWFGQIAKPYVYYLKDNGNLTEVFLLTLGVFVGMAAIGFYDKDNILGFGPYLLAALVGLLLAQLGLYIFASAEQKKKAFRYMQLISIALFALFTAFHIQVIRANRTACKNAIRDSRTVVPDYVKESLGLYFDFMSLFRNMRF